VWLDAVERCYIEEMGGMNLFFVFQEDGKTTVVTPELTGTLLPGITRDTLLTLSSSLGYGTEERRITVNEWRDGVASGAISEVFACGTAAVITPVGQVKATGFGMTINNMENGPVAMRLRDVLLDIQHGVVPDTHGWMHQLA
jgi:branched-chain amino acid aminotransferase